MKVPEKFGKSKFTDTDLRYKLVSDDKIEPSYQDLDECKEVVGEEVQVVDNPSRGKETQVTDNPSQGGATQSKIAIMSPPIDPWGIGEIKLKVFSI